jgi:hypothetical protein
LPSISLTLSAEISAFEHLIKLLSDSLTNGASFFRSPS